LPGEHYRLTVTFEARGPEGKVAELLYLVTNRDRITIPVHTAALPRLYTFPGSVEMGKFPVSEIRGNPETARTAAQILMVYRKNSTDFEIRVTSDIPFPKIESEQGPLGDRWKNTIGRYRNSRYPSPAYSSTSKWDESLTLACSQGCSCTSSALHFRIECTSFYCSYWRL